MADVEAIRGRIVVGRRLRSGFDGCGGRSDPV